MSSENKRPFPESLLRDWIYSFQIYQLNLSLSKLNYLDISLTDAWALRELFIGSFGTGKTFAARMIVSVPNMNPYSADLSTLVSK